jgi:hypothetical protein
MELELKDGTCIEDGSGEGRDIRRPSQKREGGEAKVHTLLGQRGGSM